MNARSHFILGTFSVLAVAGSMLFPKTAFAQAAEVEDVQVLTRGPVHEAFAETVSSDPVAGMIISSRPPDAIEEIPPEQQLEGDNVTWISGYWAWDDDQKDFIWISGIWRNLPPGRQWVPGYWNEIDGGQSQWTSGYWADATTSEVSYVSTAPPRNIDVGPNVEAPSSDHSWVPGNWMWADTRYAWRPGYWSPQRENWMWIPSRYNWTRRGYIYVDGYWDYSVARRGVLFAPLYFRNHVYSRPDYYYTPTIVVGLDVFSSHLFVRPLFGHYYFGDYYAPRYRDSGFYASFSWGSGHHGYDPIYAYDRWDHRGDRGWERRRSDDFNYFRDNENARPPHTFAAMRDARADRFNDGRNRSYATPLASYAKESKSGQRFRTLDESNRKKFVSQDKAMRQFGQQRRQTESRAIVAGDNANKTASREKLTRSPIAGRGVERLAKNEMPPKRPEARGDKVRVIPAGKYKPQDGVSGKNENPNSGKRQDGNNANDRSTERGVTPRDDEARNSGKAAAPGQNRDGKTGKAGKAENPAPRREADAVKESSKRKTPDRATEPKPEVRPAPERKNQDASKREGQPKPQVAPKREAQPKPQAEPKRQEQPKPQAQRAPQREPQPKAKERPAPERKPQAAPKREAQPSPQARQEPQRKAQAAPNREAQPKPQAAPQRADQSGRKGNKTAEEAAADKKRKGSKE